MPKSPPHQDSNRRIVVIGPVLPYRGGIAQYNTYLMRSILKQGLAEFGVSFSRQYPRWLYPGDSDIDSAHANHVEHGIRYVIDSMNPITWWKTYQCILASKPRLVVFHWWTVFWGPCFSLIAFLLKRKKIRVAFICHNLEDHDAVGIKARLAAKALSMADSYLVHSKDHLRTLQERYPGKSTAFHPIPLYGHYPDPKGSLPKRGRLELLFFGFIRPYKGLDVLLDAIGLLKDDQIHLTVVGESWGDAEELRASAMRINEQVELHLRYTSDEEAAEFFDRADFVVLPYRTATGSAVAAVAHRYSKPVLATRVGGLPDVVIDGETGFLVDPGDAEALAACIRTLSRDTAATLARNVSNFTSRWTWDSLALTLGALAESSQITDSHDDR